MDKRMRYFCYGSNLNIEQMGRRCPAARAVSQAILHDYRLEFRGNGTGMGFCSIEKAKGKKVLGGLWYITERCLRSLDRYEGYPSLYKRVIIPVETDTGIVKAMTYVMTPGHQITMPSSFYVETCLQGYEDFELDKRCFLGTLRGTPARMHSKAALIQPTLRWAR